MKTIRSTIPVLALFALACITVAPTMSAVTPTRDADDDDDDTAEEIDALFRPAGGTDISAVRSDALSSSTLATSASQKPMATWNITPINGDWNTAANWTPAVVPNADNATAKFDFSTITQVATSTATTVHNLIFNAGASAFTIFGPLTVHGGGIFNNSGIEQDFVGSFFFEEGATAGTLTSFHTNGGFIFFREDNSTAGSGVFINSGGTTAGSRGGRIEFFKTTAGAGNATFTNNGGAVSGALGGLIHFRASGAGTATFINNGGAVSGAFGGEIKLGSASADNAVFINNGGAVFGARGAHLILHEAFGANATFIANGGNGPGSGGSILIRNASGGNARVEVFGNGNLDVSRPRPAIDTVGSIEGSGLIFLGASQLIVGGNNLSTTFSGVISDTGGDTEAVGGSLVKGGSGTLALTNGNTYTGGTLVSGGELLVANDHGSATGAGPVEIGEGTLGGAGIISGQVTVGAGGGAGALLSPSKVSGSGLANLRIQSALVFNSDATYDFQLNSKTAKADRVTANGVTISNSAQLSFADLDTSKLPSGTVFTIINNTSASPIAGTFSNLPDGATFTSGGNTFRASYEGCDGNDLTLTVQ
jgi:autotransporter-associated beta strand protein